MPRSTSSGSVRAAFSAVADAVGSTRSSTSGPCHSERICSASVTPPSRAQPVKTTRSTGRSAATRSASRTRATQRRWVWWPGMTIAERNSARVRRGRSPLVHFRTTMSLELPLQALPEQRPRLAPRQVRPRRRSAERRILNRELSWIDFDRRVLGLAADPELPLLDRVRFCAITSSNLDEFFAVRIAELHEQAATGAMRRAADRRTPGETLADARRAISALQADQDALWLEDLRPALANAKIRFCRPEECRPGELRSLTKRFEREVLPLLTPLAVSPGGELPHVPSLGLNVGVLVAQDDGPRFVT